MRYSQRSNHHNSVSNRNILHAVILTVFGVALLVFISAVMPVRAQQNSSPVEDSSGQILSSDSDPAVAELQKEKLQLEVQKLKLENQNNERSLLTPRGWTNLLFGSGSVIVAIVLGFWGLYRYLQERRENLRNKEDERFEMIVKSLGSQSEQERINAAGLLSTFLRSEYKRFYIQVFNLAAGNLRSYSSVNVHEDPDEQLTMVSSLHFPDQSLVNILRESYPISRDLLLKRFKNDNKTLLMGRYLNAANVNLENAYLAGADLEYAWLRGSTLRKAVLKGVDLTRGAASVAVIKCHKRSAASQIPKKGGIFISLTYVLGDSFFHRISDASRKAILEERLRQRENVGYQLAIASIGSRSAMTNRKMP